MGIPYELTQDYVHISKREKSINDTDEIVNFIYDIDSYLRELEYRLFNEGLCKSDISEIELTLRKLHFLDFRIKCLIEKNISGIKKEERFNDLIQYQKYLLRVIGEIGVRFVDILKDLRLITGECSLTEFIKDNSSLLHLVSTNNHSNQSIRKVSDDSFFYLCQFHNERIPSMRIKNNKNRIFCFGCGIDANIFEYLSEYESISYIDAINLVAEINKINIHENPFKSDDSLVKKYTCHNALKRYEKRVLDGRKRAEYKNKTLSNVLAMRKYDQELATIGRIRNNEYIEYPDTSIQKRLVYKEVNLCQHMETI